MRSSNGYRTLVGGPHNGLIIAQPVTGSASYPGAATVAGFLWRASRLRALVDDLSYSGDGDQQEYDEQHEEQPGEKLGDDERRAGDAREAKERGHETYDEEREREVQHLSSLQASNSSTGSSPSPS